MSIPNSQIPFEPLADPEAVVQASGVRITVLTARLIRLEYSPSERFEDRPSQVFWFRRQPVPEFSIVQSEDRLEIDTGMLDLVYKVSEKGFTPTTLSILVRSTGNTWQFGDLTGWGNNLGGTARTLDEAVGAVQLEPGLVGRAGWAVVDDSRSLLFNRDGWLESRTTEGNLDLYFFGYGHDFAGCQRDFNLVAGKAPLIPRWALGNWWSRYWAYTQEELLGLMDEFRKRQIPLSVCIVDMDWHITETGNRCSGWTGYTWNQALFPNPQAFIDRLHEMGLKTALNLHPAEGVHPHEAQYPSFARWMDINPESKAPIPFDPADRCFMQGYFELLHHPFEAMGVDFWWIDWQQGGLTRMEGLDPLWWLNHLHYYDLGRDGKRRPFIFSRWGGLGNHRYPIGFSGDTVVGWEALEFQPFFTATAANVGYGWWSHDIGGHMGGIEDDELYTRWVQYGVFSPILRLHCTNNPYHERRPWGRNPVVDKVACEALRLRHRLIPYIYSMAWRHYSTGIPLITPMYYSNPASPEAYQSPQQYWFGSELLAAPYTRPASEETGLSRKNIWFPAGIWFNFFDGEMVQGGRWQTFFGGLEEIPVFAREGAILPLGPDTGWEGTANPATLEVLIFPGADNHFDLVEDDGETTDYSHDIFSITVLEQCWRDSELFFIIHPARGDISTIPEERVYNLSIRGITRPDKMQGWLNAHLIEIGFEYDRENCTAYCHSLTMRPTDKLEMLVGVDNGNLLASHDRRDAKLCKYLRAFRMETKSKWQIEQSWDRISTGELSLRSFEQLSEAQMNVLRNLVE